MSEENCRIFPVDKAPLGHRIHEQLLVRLDQAERLLHDSAVTHEAAVHQSRKNMKWVRAVLRLLADAGHLDLTEEERLCRDIGRRLSELRDADVTLLTLRQVVLASRGALTRKDVAELEHELEQRRARLLDEGAFDTAFVSVIRDELGELARDLTRRSPPTVQPEELERVVEATRADAEALYRNLVSRAHIEQWHALRKRVKREYYQRGLMAAAADADRVVQLDRLGELLGWQQDLAVLRRTASDLGMLTPGLRRQITRQIGNCRRRCRRQAEKVYA